MVLTKLLKCIIRTTSLYKQDINQCKDICNPIEFLIQSNEIKLQSLSHGITNKSSTKIKISLEFVGLILKFIFRNLDADDARNHI